MALVRVEELTRVAWFDPSGGKARRQDRSRAAIVVLGMDSIERIFILSAWAAHCTTEHQIRRVFDTNAKWKPRTFGMDSTGNQSTLADTIRKRARDEEIQLPLRPLALQEDKDTFIETTLQPVSSAGRMFRLDDHTMRELKLEWTAFRIGSAGMRDLLDCVARAYSLLPKRQPSVQEEMRNESLINYLRGSGATEEQIRTRLREMHPD